LKVKILQDYVDACELVKETEQDINNFKKKKMSILHISAKGSMTEFPYTEQNYYIKGEELSNIDDAKLQYEEKLLLERKQNAEITKVLVQDFINAAPARIQRIIRMKFFEGLSWEQVADRIGRKASGDSVRKEFTRYMEQD
jgi:DNA-directed RNA polymerase specialized sigma24 family protein